MKIIQIARRFVRQEWGGVETSVLETAKQLQSRGHCSEIVTSTALCAQPQEVVDGVKVTRHRHFYPYWGLSPQARDLLDRKGGNLVSLPLLRALQREQGVDLFHVHTLNRLGGIVRYVARQRGIPYVVSIHGGIHDLPAAQAEQLAAPTKGAVEWGKILGWWLGSRKVLRDAAAVICYGQREYDLTRQQLPDRRVVMMPHGVDARRFARGQGQRFRQAINVPPTASVLLCIARIDPQKDQMLVIRALPEILKAQPNTYLVMMGPVTNGPYATQLRRAVSEAGIESRVRILPGVDPADPLLVDAFHAADVFVLPSMHEAFGIVVLEAWATGLPVVATDVGGISSLVRDGRDGLLFESGDLPALVQHCCRMLCDRELSEMLRIEALDRVQREFSWESVTDRLAELYREVAHEPVSS